MKKLAIPYLLIALVTGLYSSFFGDYSYASLTYNFGRAIVWPVNLLRSDPEIDGSSIRNLQLSFQKLIDAHDRYEGKIYAVASVGNILLLKYVEDNPDVSQQEIEGLLSKIPTYKSFVAIDNMLKTLQLEHQKYNQAEIYTYLSKKIDGYDYSDLISEGDDAIEEIRDISEDRPKYPKIELVTSNTIKEKEKQTITAPTSGEKCVDYYVDNLRAEIGPDAIIKYDQVQEFRERCGLPKEEW